MFVLLFLSSVTNNCRTPLNSLGDISVKLTLRMSLLLLEDGEQCVNYVDGFQHGPAGGKIRVTSTIVDPHADEFTSVVYVSNFSPSAIFHSRSVSISK